MLIPRLTIRGILISMIGFGFLFLVLADAVRGKAWAMAFTLAVSTIGLLALLSVIMFFISLGVDRVFRKFVSAPATRAGSPFASAGPPPQVVPPEESVE